MIRLPFILVAALLPTTGAYAEFPRASVPEIQDGLAAPFEGRWSMAFAADENTIPAEVLRACSIGVDLAVVDQTHLRYSTSHDQYEFEVFEFENRTTWYPEGGPTSIAVWLDADSFLLYVTDMGQADWSAPYRFDRCD